MSILGTIIFKDVFVSDLSRDALRAATSDRNVAHISSDAMVKSLRSALGQNTLLPTEGLLTFGAHGCLGRHIQVITAAIT
jgi:hypothetical protein